MDMTWDAAQVVAILMEEAQRDPLLRAKLEAAMWRSAYLQLKQQQKEEADAV